MTNALFSGLSGLRANQQYLNVIGNNLANSNTPGYKGSRVTFGDVFSQTLSRGSAPTAALGGVNASQLGRGVAVASVDQNFAQGSLLNTGRTLDLALQGDGFFVLSDGVNKRYSRVGAFDLDAQQNLVDVRTGLRVQASGGGDIRIPLKGVVPPQTTSVVSFRGSLPAVVTGPTIERWASSSPFKEAYAAQASGAATGPFDFSGPGANQLIVTVSGVPKAITLQPGTNLPLGANLAALTASEVAAAINDPISGLSGATASVSGGGLVQITTNGTGNTATIAVGGGAGAVLGFPAGTTVGVETPADLNTQLNDLKNNTVDYVTGDQIRVTATKADGTNVSANFTYGVDGTTLGDLVTFTNALYGGDAAVTLDAQGAAYLTATASGESSITLSFADDTVAGGGSTTFTTTEFEIDVEGKKPDTAQSSITVFDSLGVSHTLSTTFERLITGDWKVTASVDAADGTIAPSTLPTLTFDSSGNLPPSTGGSLDLIWNGGAAAQTISLRFVDSTTGEAMTQLAGGTGISAVQDGYAPGTLSSISVEQDGSIRGRYSNGQVSQLAQLAIAVVSNPAGLERAGSGLFAVGGNSGQPVDTTAGSGGAGTIVSGALEGSNVDVAEEFVRLIEAQRGFQANARVISTSNEVLAELTRIGQ